MKAKLLGLFVAMVAVALMSSPAEAGDCRGVLQIQSQAVYAQPVQLVQQQVYQPAQFVQVQRVQQVHYAQPIRQQVVVQRVVQQPVRQQIVVQRVVQPNRGRNVQVGLFNFGR